MLSGYRSIPLRTTTGEPTELSSLLVEITMGTSTNEDLQSILQEINKLSAERDELVRRIVRQSKKGLIDTREVRASITVSNMANTS